MSILLDADTATNPQDHLDELTLRVSVWFVAVGMLTLVWSLYIDEVLDGLLTLLSPCTGPCMNVYDPAQWSAVRWSTSLLLALFSTLPLMLYHLHQFAKPGLLKSEYQALRQWTSCSSLVFLLAAYGLVFHALPGVYHLGYEQHLSAGLVAQYDAVYVLMVALYIVWISWLFFATWLLIFITGTLGLVTKATADWWRLRVYGVGTLLIIVTVPQQAQSLMLPLLTLYLFTMEAVGSTWFHQTTNTHGHAKQRFDEEGRRRTYSLIDCSCEGANTHHGHARVEGFSTLTVESLCRSTSDQEQAYEHLMRNGLTDAVITGCNTNNCPERFKDNLAILNIKLHGLDLMRLQSHRITNAHPTLDLLLCLDNALRRKHGEEPAANLRDVIKEHGYLPTDVSSVQQDSTIWGPYTSNGPMYIQ